MSENIPNTPTGATPPKPAEAAKVQPKKETVRINLPPKPTAAPTIKIPAPAVAAAAAAPVPSAPTAAAPVSAQAAPSQAVAAAPRSAPSAPSRPAMPSRAPAVSGLDKGLALAAALVALALAVRLFMLGS